MAEADNLWSGVAGCLVLICGHWVSVCRPSAACELTARSSGILAWKRYSLWWTGCTSSDFDAVRGMNDPDVLRQFHVVLNFKYPRSSVTVENWTWVPMTLLTGSGLRNKTLKNWHTFTGHCVLLPSDRSLVSLQSYSLERLWGKWWGVWSQDSFHSAPVFWLHVHRVKSEIMFWNKLQLDHSLSYCEW